MYRKRRRCRGAAPCRGPGAGQRASVSPWRGAGTREMRRSSPRPISCEETHTSVQTQRDGNPTSGRDKSDKNFLRCASKAIRDLVRVQPFPAGNRAITWCRFVGHAVRLPPVSERVKNVHTKGPPGGPGHATRGASCVEEPPPPKIRRVARDSPHCGSLTAAPTERVARTSTLWSTQGHKTRTHWDAAMTELLSCSDVREPPLRRSDR